MFGHSSIHVGGESYFESPWIMIWLELDHIEIANHSIPNRPLVLIVHRTASRGQCVANLLNVSSSDGVNQLIASIFVSLF